MDSSDAEESSRDLAGFGIYQSFIARRLFRLLSFFEAARSATRYHAADRTQWL
jgi:hypothetical protein